MALNFLGLGFSFGAKDAGLKNKQRDVASGFENISDEVERMGRRAEAGTKPLGHMTDQISGSAMDRLTDSINTLAESLGKDLPQASRKGAGSLHRATANIESDERRIGGGFDFIRGSYEKLSQILSVNKIQTFLQAISLEKLGAIGNKLGGIANEGRNLTTSLEQTIVTANKTSRQMGANFGLAGKALGRFTGEATSMGIALNIGTEKAGEAVYNITLATKELSAVGLKSASDLAKFAEVSGVSAGEVTQIFKQAGQQFHLTDKQLQQLAGSALESGKQLGDIGGQFKKMPQIMELISRRAAVLGKKLDPQQMADFAGQTLAVSGAFYNMGVSADDAREMALSMAEKMVESGEKFGNMFAGTETDISDFQMALGIATGDIENGFKTMTQGPGEFMSGLAEMVLKSKKSGKFTADSMNLLRGQLEKTFGPKQAATMINFFDQADEKQLELMKTTSKASGDLGKFAKAGFSTGRSIGETFDLMEQKFVMNFRNIGRASARDFVDKTGKEFNKFNAQMQELVKKGGPLGKLVEKFSEMHQIGALSLLPQTLRPMAAVFGTMVKEAGPMIGILGSLGFRLNMLTSPFTAIIAAAAILGGWFVSLRMEGKSTGEALKIMSSKIAAGAKKLWSTVKGWMGMLLDYLASVDWGAVFMRIFEALVYVWKEADAILRKIPWKAIFEGVMSAVGKIFQFIASEKFANALVRVFEYLGDTMMKLVDFLGVALKKGFEKLAEMDIGGIAKHFVDMFGRIFAVIGRYIAAAFEKVLALFEYTASKGFRDKLMKIAEGVAEGVRAVINKLFDLVNAAFDYLLNIDFGKVVENILMTAANIAAAVLHVLISGLEAFVARLPELLSKAIDLVIKLFKEIPPAVGRFLSKAAEMIGPLMKRAVIAILDGIWAILAAIPELVKKAFLAIPDIIRGIGTLIKGAIDFVFKAILGVFDAIEEWLSKKFPSAANVIHVIFAALKAVITAVWKVIKFVVDAIVAVFGVLWKVVGGILKALWWAFDTFVLTPLGWIWSLIKKVGEGIAWLVGKLVGAAKAIGGVLSKVGGFFSSVGSKIAGFFSSSSLTDVLNKQAKAATNAETYFTEGMKKAMAELQKQKEKYQEADKAWQAEKAVLDKKQLEDLKARQFTFKQVEVTSQNAAEMAKAASDAAAKGIKDNIELVDKQVRLASSLAMPKMDQSYLDAIQEYEKAEAAYNAAYKSKNLEDMEKLGDAEVEMLKKQIDTLGISGKQLKEIREEQLKTFSMRLDLQDKMSVAEKKAYQASLDQIFDKSMKAQYEGQKMVRAINEQHGQMVGNLMKAKEQELAGLGLYDLKRIEIEKKYYKLTNDLALKAAEDHAKNEQMMLNAKNKATEQKLILEKYMGVESKKIYEDIANGALKVENDKYAALSALSQKFQAETQAIMEKVPESMKTAAQNAQQEMNRAFYEQLREITSNEKLSVDERKKQLADLEAWRASKMTEFSEMVDKQTKEMVASNGAATKSMEDGFSKFSEGLQKKSEEAALKANAAVGSVQKELGLTAKEAADNLLEISKIDPAKFAKGLASIKETYISFTKVAQEEAKKMLEVTNKAFDSFNDKAVEHWTKQKSNVTLMALSEDDVKKLSQSVSNTVDKAFDLLADVVTKKVQAAMVLAFGKAFESVLVDAKKFTKDAMVIFRDLTAQMVKRFGEAWAKILDLTANAITAIQKDTERAVANLKRIEAAMRSSSVQSTATGQDVKQDVKKDLTKSDLDNIFQATHHPEWYENDFKYKAMEIITALNALATALSASPRGGTQQPASRTQAARTRSEAVGFGSELGMNTSIGGAQRRQ